MKILAYDTETTGLPTKGDLASQPHIQQLAFSLYDETRRPVFEMSMLVKLPEGVVPHPKALEVTGITSEMCNAFGVEKHQALALLRYAAQRADLLVAHNEDFDLKLLAFEAERCQQSHPFKDMKTFCTMRSATPVVNLPPTPKMLAAGRLGPKSANLGECWKFFFNEELSGAHDALVDTRGCARVFFELLDRGHIPR